MLAAATTFANHLPVRVSFGDGVIGELVRIAGPAGSRPLAIVDAGVAGLPQIRSALAAAGVAEIHRPAAGEPTWTAVDAAAAAIDRTRPDLLIAIGGGATMDVAKAARVAAGQRIGAEALFRGGPVEIAPPTIALVTVSTTAGTGSEVSGGAVVADPHTHVKGGIASPAMRAQFALVDPELTHGLPPAPTLHGGVDALAQAIAAMVVTCRTPVADAIALESIRVAARALPAVVASGADRGARSQMALASLLAGLAMNLSECGSEHWLAHAIGARHGVPHGLSVGLVLAESLEHDRVAVPGRLERVADALGAPPDDARDGSRAIAAVRRLLAAVDFPTLAGVGISSGDLPALADTALAGWIPVVPTAWTRADMVAAYERALAIGDRRRPLTEKV